MAKTGRGGGGNWYFWLPGGSGFGKHRNYEYRDGIPAAWSSGESPRVATSSYSGDIRSIFYRFDTSRLLKSLISELLIGNDSLHIPSSVRNDNAEAVCQFPSINSVTKRGDYAVSSRVVVANYIFASG